jgi:hypothetical protein
MPSKSRRSRGKHPHQSKKSKAIQRQEALATKPPVSEKPAQIKEPVIRTAPKLAETPSRQRIVSYPYVLQELLTIGVLAAIVIIILIILAVTIS